MRSSKVMKPMVLYMKEYNNDRVEGELSTIHQNYYTQLYKLDDKEMKNIEIAGLGCGFHHTSKLKVKKFKEALKVPAINGKKKSKMNTNKW